ncbi:heme peroxidase [Massarina eburnea CBS 473.64]|uniref:Peroxidase n=1 Tax=Massarina eburnea CBS 473.64 TaxID=1395130 RepID=A0A6A6RZZ1_9PLEO|nr:heme peroxidase [Massarina eburnea CBS 473.64]
MYISSFVTILAASSTIQAFQLSDVKAAVGDVTRSDQCAVWKNISSTLTEQFLGSDGQCTDAARAAIRSSFHDCFNGACDGSLILANECSNTENIGLAKLCSNLGPLATQKNVSTADLIQFAAAHAIKTCPGGPTVPFKFGRKDSYTANALGVLPSGNISAIDAISLFAQRGFSAIDLAALIGAHTAAKQFVSIPAQSGQSLDSTPGQWDNKYYSETIAGKAPVTLQSDTNLANNLVTKVPFVSFAASQAAWSVAFVPAMTKMSMIGVSGVKLTDCTSALPGGSSKRDVKRAPLLQWWKS